MKLKALLCLQVLEEGGRGPMGKVLREQAQPSRWRVERVGTCGEVSVGSQGVHRKSY